nr:hypothetical protein [Bowmanella yangjiangensis]
MQISLVYEIDVSIRCQPEPGMNLIWLKTTLIEIDSRARYKINLYVAAIFIAPDTFPIGNQVLTAIGIAEYFHDITVTHASFQLVVVGHSELGAGAKRQECEKRDNPFHRLSFCAVVSIHIAQNSKTKWELTVLAYLFLCAFTWWF